MDTEYFVSRAAECLFSAVQSAEPREQHAMLELAQVWLQRAEGARNNRNQASAIAQQHRPTEPTRLPIRKGLRRKNLRRAGPAGAVAARGAERRRSAKKNRSR